MTQQPDRAPVKLAVIEQGFVMGGAEVNLLWLLPPLKERGFDSLVLCPREGEVTRRFSAADIACRIVPLPPLFSVSFRLLGRKVDLARRRQFAPCRPVSEREVGLAQRP